MKKTITGIDFLAENASSQELIKGNIGVLCHSASIKADYQHTLLAIKSIYKDRLKKIFGPQHGFVTDVQDNMAESKDFIHPFFNLLVRPIFSVITNRE